LPIQAFGYAPFAAIRVITGFAQGVIGQHPVDQVLAAGVTQLMRFTGWEKKGLIGPDLGEPALVTDSAPAGDDDPA
jgi:hypothetical protein